MKNPSVYQTGFLILADSQNKPPVT